MARGITGTQVANPDVVRYTSLIPIPSMRNARGRERNTRVRNTCPPMGLDGA